MWGRGRAWQVGALVVVLLSGALFAASSAAGYWSSVGTGAGSASTGTLAAPTAVRAAASGVANAAISWTASAVAPGIAAPTGYYVIRTNGGASTAACASSPSALLTTTACTDSGLTSGSYTYTVVAAYRTWTAISAASDPVVVAPSSQLAFPQNPQPVSPSGSSIGTVIVALESATGATLTTSGVAVTLKLSANTTAGVLSGTLTQSTSQNGTATFNGLSVDKAGSYTLTATSSGYQSATSTSFTITSGQARNLSIVSGSAQHASVGVAFSNPLVVLVTDSAGNPVSGTTVAFSAPSGGASAAFIGNNNYNLNATSASNGVASVTARAGSITGSYQVTASVSGTNTVVFQLTNS